MFTLSLFNRSEWPAMIGDPNLASAIKKFRAFSTMGNSKRMLRISELLRLALKSIPNSAKTRKKLPKTLLGG